MEEDVDARALREDFRADLADARGVTKVARVPVDGAAGRLDGADRDL